MLIILTLPNRAPAVELVIRQPQDCQPSSTLPPYITQDGGLRDTNVHGMPDQPIPLQHGRQ